MQIPTLRYHSKTCSCLVQKQFEMNESWEISFEWMTTRAKKSVFEQAFVAYLDTSFVQDLTTAKRELCRGNGQRPC
jgi:hypothetical protein